MVLGSDSHEHRGAGGFPLSPLVREKSVGKKALILEIHNCCVVEEVLTIEFWFPQPWEPV